MAKFKLNILKLPLIFLMVFLSTCSAVPAQLPQALPIEPSSQKPTPIVSIILLPSQEPASPDSVTIEPLTETPTTLYLPTVFKPAKKFVGIYFHKYWEAKNVTQYLVPYDQTFVKRHSSVGWWIDLEDDAFTKPVTYLPGNNLYIQLEELWKAGYISFVNLSSRSATAEDIATGKRDREIGYAAEFYKTWVSQGGNRRAFIAPLQEMNGGWVSYSRDPENFKIAYRRILDIFAAKGVDRSQVWWVFSPNAWSEVGHEFEKYYPGDDVVDFVAFSSYNFGYCPDTVARSASWGEYDQIYAPFITRMRSMAPTKLIIVRETATTSYYDWNTSDINRKNQWLKDSYAYLATQSDVIGVYYFNINNHIGSEVCDFSIDGSAGYNEALAGSIWQYMTVTDLE